MTQTKQVILDFGQGSLETGFDVNLRIYGSGKIIVAVNASLPTTQQLLESYYTLKTVYRRHQSKNYQLYRGLEVAEMKTIQTSMAYVINHLLKELDYWLDGSLEFVPIRNALLKHLNPRESIRFLLKISSSILSWLPWHKTALFEQYSDKSIAFQLKAKPSTFLRRNLNERVKILPILGDDTGIDVMADLLLLQDKLGTYADLVEPLINGSISIIGDTLWTTNPNILFFFGHSSSQGGKGILQINEQDVITVLELKNSFKKAIDNGLSLVIFNSCDGLKLAEDLATLGLPAIIVMKDRIPDIAKNRFLQFFLGAFTDPTNPRSLSFAVSESQRLLQPFDKEFPCVSWLPTLFQQSDIDLTWQDLRGVEENSTYQSIPREEEWQIEHQQRQNQGIIVSLNDNFTLELMEIPTGRFTLGSPDHEPDRRANEQRRPDLEIPAFYLGRYPITQEQWCIVAQWQPVDRELTPEPAYFKDDFEQKGDRWQRPVEQISWHDAIEFCKRLSRETGADYYLPHDVQWEYACRAQTIDQPFHFGQTIDSDLANYDANDTYNGGKPGQHRAQTTPVNHFRIANPFGLSDMHGNVREWCANEYFPDYGNIPAKKFNQQIGDIILPKTEDPNAYRVLRGGSWNDAPRLCRSATRFDSLPDNRFNFVGFRVARVKPFET